MKFSEVPEKSCWFRVDQFAESVSDFLQKYVGPGSENVGRILDFFQDLSLQISRKC